MRLFSSFLLAFAALGFASLPTHGSDLFSDDFESYAAGSSLGGSNWGTAAAGDSSFRTVQNDTSGIFGNPNKYVEMADTSAVSYIRLHSPDIAAASAALTTFLFDFYEPSTGGAGRIGIGYAMPGSDLNNDGSRLRLYLDDGAVTGLGVTGTPGYSLDTAYRIAVIFNDSASPVSYDGGTVAAGTADIWLHPLSGGSPVYAGSVSAINSQTSSYSVAFRVFNADQQEILVDNVSLVTGAVMPDAKPPDCWLVCSHPVVAEGGAVTLDWTASGLSAGASYEITSNATLTFPNGDATGDATTGSGQVAVTITSASMSPVQFSIVVRDDTDAVLCQAQAEAELFDYSAPAVFPHPSITSSQGQIDFMRDQVLNHPGSLAKAGWDAMLATSYAPLSYEHTPQQVVSVVPGGSNASENAFRKDTQAVRCHALQWAVTGDPAHRDKALAILSDMGRTFESIVSTGSAAQIQLESAWALPVWLSAADIMRYHDGGVANWNPADIASFHHFARILYDHAKLAMSARNNWGVSASFAVMAYGVWSDDETIFQTGLGNQLGLLNSISWPDGYIAETCRDSWHPQYSVVTWIDSAELARNLGNLMLYEATFDGQKTPRLAIILEYFANMMLGNTAPPCGGSWGYDYVGEYYRFDNYEVAYNHYLNREGATYLPVFAEMIEDFWRNHVGADPHFLLWSRLTHGDNSFMALPPPDTYEQWADQQFTNYGITDPSLTAPDADYNSDGISNAMHYWTLTNPRTATGDLVFTVVPAESPGEFRVHFIERSEADTYGRIFLSSPDLKIPVGSWSQVTPASIELIEDHGDQVVREASFQMNEDREFFRINYP